MFFYVSHHWGIMFLGRPLWSPSKTFTATFTTHWIERAPDSVPVFGDPGKRTRSLFSCPRIYRIPRQWGPHWKPPLNSPYKYDGIFLGSSIWSSIWKIWSSIWSPDPSRWQSLGRCTPAPRKLIFPFLFEKFRFEKFFHSLLNQMEFHLVQNRKENCHHDHIPFN